MQNILTLKSICENFIFVYPKYTHCGFVLQKKKRKPGRIDKGVKNIAFRFYGVPDKEQEHKLLCTIGSARFIWNAMLADAIDSKEKTGVYEVNGYTLYKKDNPWLNDIDSIALANANMDLNKAFDDYREGDKGRPRFKKKHICKASYATNVSNKKKPNLRLEGDMLIIPKVGKVKLCMHRKAPENAVLKNCYRS